MSDFEAICRLCKQIDMKHAQIIPDMFRKYDGEVRPKELIAKSVEADDAEYFLAELDGEAVGLLNTVEQETPRRMCRA